MSNQGSPVPGQPDAPPAKKGAPALGRREFFRWIWRQLTSMRTALFLLLILALAAIPGSLFPQRNVEAEKVTTYFAEHPKSAPILDSLGMFSVYTSVWFSAIYLLLMVSLVGCILPRSALYLRHLRARPPKAPRRFSRFAQSARFETDATIEDVLSAGKNAIGKPARIDVVHDPSGTAEVRSEKGYLREAGNLVFHICVVIVLVGVASSALFGYEANAIVSQGDGFSNSLTQYDEFSAGSLFSPDTLAPFSFDVDKVSAKFQTDGPQRGAPRHFELQGRYVETPGAESQPFDITVNHPVQISGTDVFLIGVGYSPKIKVTDSKGNVAFDGAVPFLPEDPTYTSTGVIKVPDAQPEQLGFQGFFLPTAVTAGEETPISAFPGAANPLLGLFVYHGNLGLDGGESQSVYVLEKDQLEQYTDDDGEPVRLSISPGQTADLPDGGTISFEGLTMFARLQISHTPWLTVPLWGIIIGVLGLMASLTIKPRRTWVRASRGDDGRTVVEVASLDRVPRGDADSDFATLMNKLHGSLGSNTNSDTGRDNT